MGAVGVLDPWGPLGTQRAMFLPTLGVFWGALGCCRGFLFAPALFRDLVLWPTHFLQALSLGLIQLLGNSCLDA